MDHSEITYILSANKAAMDLYKESKETLIKSASYDFMVFKCSDWDDILEDMQEWEDYMTIDESTYHTLYSNLCIKFRALIKFF
ncbi:hypothetical protein [Changchengzhania lutea]|uniref:hypothetical protein n=1 Tax=Changchengzhania lutea TaxID=2049305 RepID=UPI00115D1071|nr:hypothetical protein [Changchengzhania lutea]